MTKEQEEAIKLATKFTKMNFSNPMGWTGYYDTELNELSIAIETVLNMLKEKELEIEKYKKIINLMTEHIVSSAIVDDTVCAIKCDCETDINEDCTHEKMLNCTKQYFERKVE